MNLKNFLNWWLPVVLWCGVIFFFSSLPTVETTKIYWWDFTIKKTFHILEYAVLYFLFFRAINKESFKNSGIKKTSRKFLLPFLACLIYSLSDEFHQRFVPGRHSKLMDVGFDSFGAFLSSWKIRKYLK